MQVSKWGNSLAVRLPTAVVDALDLKEGNQMGVQVLVGWRVCDVDDNGKEVGDVLLLLRGLFMEEERCQ